jgi:hypothetical protein
MLTMLVKLKLGFKVRLQIQILVFLVCILFNALKLFIMCYLVSHLVFHCCN